MDGKINASPLALYWKKDKGTTWEYKLVDHPHHINSRDNTGLYDGVEWLITLNRLEHDFCEKGCKPLGLTGTEYTYLLLYLKVGKPDDRWEKARVMLSRKMSEKRFKVVIKIAKSIGGA